MFRGYLIKRIVSTLIIFFVILNLTFLIFYVIDPIKPVQWFYDRRGSMTVELYASMNRMYGLDQPLYVQWERYMINILTLQFGLSFVQQKPVLSVLMQYLPNTLALILTATVIEIVVGIMVGLYAASKRGLVDFSLTGFGVLVSAVPAFLIFLVFRYVFSENLRWFPITGIIVAGPDNPILYLGDFLYHMALPLITLTIYGFGGWAFYARNFSVEILTQDYIQTARAKGVNRRGLMFKHVLSAMMPPILTMVMMALPNTIFGAMMTEYVFTWKGVGWWYLDSIYKGDYPVVQTMVVIYSILLLGANFLSDILYGYLDPRVRVGGRK
jgi:peptide/nickel transport system permease protein